MREETKNTKARVGRAADAGGNEATGQDGWIDGTRGRRGRSMSMDGWIMDRRTHTRTEMSHERRQGHRQQRVGGGKRESCVCLLVSGVVASAIPLVHAIYVSFWTNKVQ